MSRNRGGITFEFKSNRDAVNGTIETALHRALDRIAIRWQAEAKLAAPVDTGRLRASIAFSTPNVQALHTETFKEGVVQYQPPDVQGLTAQVGTNVEYGLVVHEGLSGTMAFRQNNTTQYRNVKRKPNKFIETPGRQLAPTFRSIVDEEIRKATGGTR